MNSEQFAEHFSKAGVDLEQFLSIDDDKLKQIGVQYPFQRHLIKRGLREFFTEPWSRSSFDEILTLIDSEVFSYEFLIFFSNLLKQSMILKSHMLHVVSHAEQVKFDTVMKFDATQLNKFRKNLAQLKTILSEIERKSKENSLQRWNNDSKSFGNALKYAIFAFSSTFLLFVFRRFFKR